MNPTCEQIDNARLLANTLEKVAEEHAEHFDMGTWVGHVVTPEQMFDHLSGVHPDKCGTTGCALGWAPYALGANKSFNESWQEYACRLFGFNIGSTWFPYIFMFGNDDPSYGTDGAQAAARRLREFVAAYEQDCT